MRSGHFPTGPTPRRCAGHLCARPSPRNCPCRRTAEQCFGSRNYPRRVKQFRKPLASKRCMSIPNRKDFNIIGDRESRITSLGEWTQNNKAAGRRLVVELSLCHQILERAKGFEPSTPTLARSCSTTELHPHPRDWRRSLTGNAQSYAKCRPRMQQPARDLRIGRITRYRELLRVNQPETSRERPPGSSVAASGNPAGRLAIVLRRDSSHLPNQGQTVRTRCCNMR